jgi:hypothetical protein
MARIFWRFIRFKLAHCYNLADAKTFGSDPPWAEQDRFWRAESAMHTSLTLDHRAAFPSRSVERKMSSR